MPNTIRAAAFGRCSEMFAFEQPNDIMWQISTYQIYGLLSQFMYDTENYTE